ncbi:MAG: hypothetical protein RI900_417, partial [Actinomycetota bacterium]
PNSDEFVEAAAKGLHHIPAPVRNALQQFMHRPPACGALLLDGLPVGDLPATPPTPWGRIEKDLSSDLLLLTVAHALGHPMGYAAESKGLLTPHIVPTPGESYRQVSTSSEVDLVFHTEGSYAHHKPRYLLLLCLRGDPAAATTLAPVAHILPLLDDHTRQVLSQPRFRIAVDETYVQPGERRLTPQLAALTGDPADPQIVFDADLMEGADDEAHQAFLRLCDAAVASRLDVVLSSGQMLVIDNHRTAHGRSAFTPRFDGTDRWMQRCFVMADPTVSDGERSGRVITRPFGT